MPARCIARTNETRKLGLGVGRSTLGTLDRREVLAPANDLAGVRLGGRKRVGGSLHGLAAALDGLEVGSCLLDRDTLLFPDVAELPFEIHPGLVPSPNESVDIEH